MPTSLRKAQCGASTARTRDRAAKNFAVRRRLDGTIVDNQTTALRRRHHRSTIKEKRQFTGSITIPKRAWFHPRRRGRDQGKHQADQINKSLHGLIVTLFRQTRVDTYSNISRATPRSRRSPPTSGMFRADVRSLSNWATTTSSARTSRSRSRLSSSTPRPCAPRPRRAARAGRRVPDHRQRPGRHHRLPLLIEVLVDMKGKPRAARAVPPVAGRRWRCVGAGGRRRGQGAREHVRHAPDQHRRHPGADGRVPREAGRGHRHRGQLAHEQVEAAARGPERQRGVDAGRSTQRRCAPRTRRAAAQDRPHLRASPPPATAAATSGRSSSCTPTPVPRRTSPLANGEGASGEARHDPAPDYTPRHEPPPGADGAGMSEKERLRLAGGAAAAELRRPAAMMRRGRKRRGEEWEEARVERSPSAPHPALCWCR